MPNSHFSILRTLRTRIAPLALALTLGSLAGLTATPVQAQSRVEAKLARKQARTAQKLSRASQRSAQKREQVRLKFERARQQKFDRSLSRLKQQRQRLLDRL